MHFAGAAGRSCQLGRFFPTPRAARRVRSAPPERFLWMNGGPNNVTRLGIADRVLPMIVVICALGTGCGSPNAPTPMPSPSPTPPIAPAVLTSLIGTVVDRTPQGERPLGGAFVWGQLHSGRLLGQVRADEFGRYELPGLAQGDRLQVMATKEGYFQQCAAEITVGEIPHLDLPLVAEANLSSSRDSVPPSPPEFRIVAGVVFEPTTQGRRAVANRLVYYDWGLDPAAVTRTDDQGRFLICGLPQSRTVSIAADFGGGIAWASVPPGGDADIEIEVKK